MLSPKKCPGNDALFSFREEGDVASGEVALREHLHSPKGRPEIEPTSLPFDMAIPEGECAWGPDLPDGVIFAGGVSTNVMRLAHNSVMIIR